MSNMFKVACLVENKKLGDVLSSLFQIGVHDLTQMPVLNAAIEKGKVIQATDGTVEGLFVKYLLKHGGITSVDAAIVRDFLKELGRSASSVSYVIRKAQKAGILGAKVGRGNRSTYPVVRKALK